MLVVLAHVFEALHLFPWMHWGGREQRWSFPRFLECRSWPHIISARISASSAYKAAQLMGFLELTGGELQLAGLVRHAQPAMGVEFVDLKPETLAVINVLMPKDD